MVIKFKNFRIETLSPTGYKLTVFREGQDKKTKKPKMMEDITYPGSIEYALNSALKQITNNSFKDDDEIYIQEYLKVLKEHKEDIKKVMQEEKICL